MPHRYTSLSSQLLHALLYDAVVFWNKSKGLVDYATTRKLRKFQAKITILADVHAPANRWHTGVIEADLIIVPQRRLRYLEERITL